MQKCIFLILFPPFFFWFNWISTSSAGDLFWKGLITQCAKECANYVLKLFTLLLCRKTFKKKKISLTQTLTPHCDSAPSFSPLFAEGLSSPLPPPLSHRASNSRPMVLRLPVSQFPSRMGFFTFLGSVKSDLIIFLTPCALLPLPLVIGTSVCILIWCVSRWCID